MKTNRWRWMHVALLSSIAVGGCSKGATGKVEKDAGAGRDASLGDAGASSGTGGKSSGTAGQSSGSGSSSGTAGKSSGTGGASSGTSGSSSGTGGASSGTSGSSSGTGGASSGSGGSSAGGSGHAGSGGTAGSAGAASTCGELGQACCATGASCNADLACLAQTSCSCVKKIGGFHLIRTDGAVLLENPGTAGETAVTDATTGMPLTNAVDIADGLYHGCAALADGGVACWRTSPYGNGTGQLGNGTVDPSTNTTTFRATPVLTAANTPLTNVASMATAPNQKTSSSCAITHDGVLNCWGDLTWIVNGGTQLRSGYAQPITTNGTAPLANVLQAVVANTGACAVVRGASTREVWCWGFNGGYELGQGDTQARQYPVKVLGLDDPSVVAMTPSDANSRKAVCAMDGVNIKCWGADDNYGSTGRGDTTVANVQTPTLVKLQDKTTPLDGVVDLRSGSYGFCALRSNATLWCWGLNYQSYASNYGVTNIVAEADSATPRFLTGDGVYHMGATTRAPKCGSLL
jgi:hypothetical protein